MTGREDQYNDMSSGKNDKPASLGELGRAFWSRVVARCLLGHWDNRVVFFRQVTETIWLNIYKGRSLKKVWMLRWSHTRHLSAVEPGAAKEIVLQRVETRSDPRGVRADLDFESWSLILRELIVNRNWWWIFRSMRCMSNCESCIVRVVLQLKTSKELGLPPPVCRAWRPWRRWQKLVRVWPYWEYWGRGIR